MRKKRKANKAPTELTQEQLNSRRKGRITAGVICGAVMLITGVAVVGLTLYSKTQQKRIPAMSFKDCLAYTLGGSADGMITVGIIRDGEASYTVYGTDGKELPQELRTYEIGSLTKTFTAALVQRAVDEGKLSLDDTIDKYLPLAAGKHYPTIAALLTHTSGYKGWYLEAPMIGSFFAGRNEFCGITGEMELAKLRSLDMRQTERLSSTHISSGKSELPDGWDWRENDVYLGRQRPDGRFSLSPCGILRKVLRPQAEAVRISTYPQC